MGLHWDNGKENGNDYIVSLNSLATRRPSTFVGLPFLGLYITLNPKPRGYWGREALLQRPRNLAETRAFIGVILGIYWGYVGIMENEMEAL